ncbi:rhomboid family intramembrane serine protease [Bradyrhizobium iriomotense]|uniref:rhomboid family intramembrane serine protease n=1 Tax=Bradyrhizobium iriomotense TaxID=441950 RepID=UPI001B89F51D|nr:rhomboid family intramembrane serine protease [Bradyrhizobium iriomotense]MBR1128992.1 rhomboid family intramembrane serine protease [Bradyrhizobium iriomotense]
MVVVFGDNLRRKRVAVATHIIAVACALATAVVMLAGATAGTVRALAFTPVDFSLHPVVSFYTLFTAEFVHSGSVHLVGNLIFLYAFGRSIENLVGPAVFAAAFVGLGALSFLGSWLIGPASPVPIVGASGALSFLMGAYTIVFPRAKLRIVPFLRVPYLRAWQFSSAWIALQIWSAVEVGELASGVAYATHLAGFVIGLVAGVAWKEFALDTDRLIAELSDEVSS